MTVKAMAIYDRHELKLYQLCAAKSYSELAVDLIEANALALFGSGFAENKIYKDCIEAIKCCNDKFDEIKEVLSALDIDSNVIEFVN